MKTKICTTCKKELDVKLFRLRKGSLTGLYYKCMPCLNDYGKAYYKKNRDKILLKLKTSPNRHPLRARFDHMKIRCNDKNYIHYKNYGGRGIKVEWKTFAEFVDDMYDSFLKHLKKHGKIQTTIERINNNGNYSKKNCRWATRTEQARNTRIKCIMYKGKYAKDESIKLGGHSELISWRIQHGWTLKEAFTTPKK